MAIEIQDAGSAKTSHVDFIVITAEGGDVFVETKAPYTGETADVIHRALRRLVRSVSTSATGAPLVAILATPIDFPSASTSEAQEARKELEGRGVRFEIWDLKYLIKAAAEYFAERVETFSLAELELLLSPVDTNYLPELPQGKREDVVVLVADFCSFSAFVQASGSNTALITSVMGRFYRESREAVYYHGGVLDKFMGDGILAYWFGDTEIAQFERCVQRLIGTALKLADEWQDQLDLSVEPKGLRAGAAIGPVIFIPEHATTSPIHAIGDSINIASRLQVVADPNSLVISNRLRTRYFGSRSEFEVLPADELKNIGKVIAWQRFFNGVSP